LPFPKLPWLGERGVFSARGAIFLNINFWSGSVSLRMWHLWPLDVDRTALESLQRGVNLPCYMPGQFAHLEVLVHHLLDHYVKVISA